MKGNGGAGNLLKGIQGGSWGLVQKVRSVLAGPGAEDFGLIPGDDLTHTLWGHGAVHPGSAADLRSLVRIN